MKFTNYLAFDNALKASQYYEESYGGELQNHIKLSSEHTDDIENSTFYAKLTVFGVKFNVSDRIENTDDFSGSVNMMIELNNEEKELFYKYVDYAKKDSENTFIYDNLDSNESYLMYRFKDKFNIVWGFVLILNN